MNSIICYQPEFTQNPAVDSRQIVDIHYQHETRRSLLLNELAHCQAVLLDPQAFALHISAREPGADALAVDTRLQALNQAAIDCVTLPGLNEELRLYALGVMLSTASNLPQEAECVQRIASMPGWLARHAEQGELQRMHGELPAIDVLKSQLIRELGVMSLDWTRLPDHPRSVTLPMQVGLLMLQDANSEAQMQQQLAQVWQTHGAQCQAQTPWLLTHYLVYRVYHDLFPGNHPEHSYLQLVCDYFQLKTLFSLWMMEGTALSAQEMTALIGLFEQWRVCEAQNQERDCRHELFAGNDLLAAFSLIAG
ncbi:lysine-N-methylase [Atlantibacter subterraneus]|uniref:lysine-N-methylase n=1 Tax=Atlantibacter subterraneus TaxID=255519 RepID=UPI0028A8EC3B|nr:lysine-N-methylase [Atlantibacter subterranea]